MPTEAVPGHTNRLAGETSPYLLQHASNPVDWYPWGEEAFARARAEDRPVLLSVGYSSCHWCHVMAHESFENAETAALMNEWFVNVKVDREERPDVDGVYMSAVQAITGRGGWPMTVFLTPDARPLYAGTYFPAQDGHGLPAFPRVLEAIHTAWTTERERLLASAEGVMEHLKAASRRTGGAPVELSTALTARARETFHTAFDTQWGGFGSAPKFPAPSNLEFLLAHYARAEESDAALGMVLTTLVRMAQGGIYDHLAGGFARYSVDQRWLVPHFEKMLYDNAQLARVYLHAFQLTHDDFFARVARETLDYLAREMRDPAGGFFAAEDADSEGIEGKFYVWTPAEVREVLGEDAAAICAWYGITEEGNFRDPHHAEFGSHTVLSTWPDPTQVAAQLGINAHELMAKVEAAKPRLLEARSRRVRPGLDDKVLTSWNGLALAAFAEAGRILGDDGYLERAIENAAFVRRELWQDGRLKHTWKAGIAKVDGMLEDYAYYGLGLIELFKATGDLAHLQWADELFEVIVAHFGDPAGGFFETPDDGEQLLLRERSFFDQATPSGNSAAALLAMWLGRYFSRADREDLAVKTALLPGDHLAEAPTGFGAALQVVEFALAPHLELVISGDPEGRRPLEREAATFFLPWHAIAPTATGEGLPMFEGREPEDVARAYLCQDMACGMPATTPEELATQIAPPPQQGGLVFPSFG